MSRAHFPLKKSFSLCPVSRNSKIHEVKKWHESPPEKTSSGKSQNDNGNPHIAAETFMFLELASATKNFRQEYLLGDGGFGRVYKGCLEKTGQIVAIKQLDRIGFQGLQEFLAEVRTLSLLCHENLVKLIGYCADGDQKLLVYEHMANGALVGHVIDISPDQKPLSWHARMKIALGTARGLEYLHEKANPPVIYRDLKSSNILLDENFNAKLSDFGLAKLGPTGEKAHVSSRVATYGYCAPEYAKTGQLTLKSDVYNFGMVMLELITGRRAIDTTRPTDEQNLVAWAMPVFRDQKRFPELVDPLLEDYPAKGLSQAVAVAVAAMCLQEEPSVRPLMSDVVAALSPLTIEPTGSQEGSDSAFNHSLSEDFDCEILASVG